MELTSLLLRRNVFRELETRVTRDELQGTMGRVQSFPPSFARTFWSR